MKKRFKITLTDSMSIQPIDMPAQNKQFLTDAIYTPNNTPLMVKIAATHAGIVTRNNGFYMPDKMKDGANSFVQNYGKPVLLHHNACNSDPVGRVRHAQYVDTSTGIAKQDGYIKDFVDPHVSFETKVDIIDRIIKDGVLDDPSYDGVGYIELIAAITDKEAIQKIADNRYLTVSIGAETDAAICSICKTDWAETGEICDHVPGNEYDGKQAFVIAGNLFYDEVSFVSTPADPHAKIIQIAGADGDISDKKSISCEERENKGKPVTLDMYIEKDDTKCNVISDSVTDILKIEDNHKEDLNTMKNKLIEDASNIDSDKLITDSVARIADLEAMKDIENVSDYITFAVKNHLSTIEDGKLGDVLIEDFDAAVIAIVDFIQQIVAADDEQLAKIKEDEKDTRLGLVEQIIEAFKKAEENPVDKYDLEAEPLAPVFALEASDIFDAIDEKLEELELGDSKVEDAKRKSLSKTAFLVASKDRAGIKGYFPVPNVDYLKAAIKYFDSCELPEETVTEIKKAIDRKSKVLGYEASDSAGNAKEVSVKDMSDEELKEIADKAYAELKGRGLFDACAGCEDGDKTIADLEDKIVAAGSQIEAVRHELKEAFKDTEEVNVLYAGLLDDHQTLMSQAIVDAAVLTGAEEIKIDDLKKKTVSEIKDQFNSISDTVDFSKLAEKINNGLSNDPDANDVDNPVFQHGDNKFSAETVKQVADKYTELLLSRGGIVAAQYFNDCKSKGLIPDDLESITKQ